MTALPSSTKHVFAKIRQRSTYYIPGTSWIPNYSPSFLLGDILSGLTVGCILIPQSISYATSLAHLNPLTGLYSAAIPALVYAILGSSRHLNVAPEAAVSLLVGQAVNAILSDYPEATHARRDAIAIAVSTIITFQIGLISFALGFFRLGFIDVVLSRALLRGFITAVGVVITIEQLIPMLGLVELEHAVNPQSTFDKALFLLENLPRVHRPTAIIAFTALGALVALRFTKVAVTAAMPKYFFWVRYIPEVLFVVIGSTFLSDEFDFAEQGVTILGSIPISHDGHLFAFPLLSGNVRHLKATTSTAILIAVVGFLDSIVAAKQTAARYGYTVSPNRELVALGAGNLFASFMPGTLPAYGSITRTRLNADIGARSQMTSIVCSAVILFAVFFLLPALYFLPKCVLASIICLVVYSILAEAPHDVLFYWRMRAWIDFGLMLLTFFATVVWSVEVGILVSVTVSLLLVVHKSGKTRMSILGRIPGTDRWKPINEDPDAAEDWPGVLIVRIKETLDFANTGRLKDRLRRLEMYGAEKKHPSESPTRQQTNVLVFHLADVEKVDASAVQIFLELLVEYKSRGVELYMTHVRPAVRGQFERGGVVKLLGEDRFFVNVAEAVAHIEMAELER
ncbi:sulfate permease [Auricularia subglabra TFB-10046 SS5]|nr:sulfate permease [Auricularia subglabra TFB-10046 SS5]